MGRVKTFTDLGMRADRIRDPKTADVDLEPDEEYEPEYRLFEGPKYRFSLLLGSGSIWHGPLGAIKQNGVPSCGWCGRPVVVRAVAYTLRDGTRFAGHTVRPAPQEVEPLEAYAYCLNCDRSGKDRAIGTAEPKPERVRRVYTPTPGLKGGVG